MLVLIVAWMLCLLMTYVWNRLGLNLILILFMISSWSLTLTWTIYSLLIRLALCSFNSLSLWKCICWIRLFDFKHRLLLLIEVVPRLNLLITTNTCSVFTLISVLFWPIFLLVEWELLPIIVVISMTLTFFAIVLKLVAANCPFCGFASGVAFVAFVLREVSAYRPAWLILSFVVIVIGYRGVLSVFLVLVSMRQLLLWVQNVT
jgi:hypothetical protein